MTRQRSRAAQRRSSLGTSPDVLARRAADARLMRAMAAAVSASEVCIAAGGTAMLRGMLDVAAGARGLVLFAHGSGSSRFSPRNTFVARQLREAGLGTLLFDLLTTDEERIDAETRELRFDIELLTERLIAATHWAKSHSLLRGLPVGYFGASTGAAAALCAAARIPSVGAVVSRGGRPDLAGPELAQVRAATLLIVGGQDPEVVMLNRRALAQLSCTAHLQIVPGATHLFEEPGTLELVASLAADWFVEHLGG